MAGLLAAAGFAVADGFPEALAALAADPEADALPAVVALAGLTATAAGEVLGALFGDAALLGGIAFAEVRFAVAAAGTLAAFGTAGLADAAGFAAVLFTTAAFALPAVAAFGDAAFGATGFAPAVPAPVSVPLAPFAAGFAPAGLVVLAICPSSIRAGGADGICRWSDLG